MFAEAINEVKGASITAILSRKRETGDEFVKCNFSDNSNQPSVVTDIKELFSSDVNAIYVASPNRFHAETAKEAMKAGFDVLCEKPVASNRKEYDEMLAVSEKTGKILLEAMRPAFDPAYDTVKRFLNEIGKIRHASFEYCQYSSRYDRFKGGEYMRAFDPYFSNAAVMDIGIYPIYVCAMIFGSPKWPLTARSTVFENGMEGGGEAILSYEGMNVVISYSKICDSVNPSVIIGEKGSITIDKLSSPSQIRLIKRKGTDEIIYSSDKQNNMSYEISAFGDLISKGEVKHKYAAISRISMEVTDRIRRENGIVFSAD
ncbi:MAG: Gfo/Idh/MocA family oxidoreductase [Clostridia bacterium]|nr:Gfo/Idh/MocA family oxidoreductase [Clostridia bacterium]